MRMRACMRAPAAELTDVRGHGNHGADHAHAEHAYEDHETRHVAPDDAAPENVAVVVESYDAALANPAVVARVHTPGRPPDKAAHAVGAQGGRARRPGHVAEASRALLARDEALLHLCGHRIRSGVRPLYHPRVAKEEVSYAECRRKGLQPQDLRHGQANWPPVGPHHVGRGLGDAHEEDTERRDQTYSAQRLGVVAVSPVRQRRQVLQWDAWQQDSLGVACRAADAVRGVAVTCRYPRHLHGAKAAHGCRPELARRPEPS
mmetsp:Transcript_20550/g.64463  ORF Transcript_20550/g.64463 Transcript_20550/m.64463 type:complete len:261 (+) Transcript_20550:2-784(+)